MILVQRGNVQLSIEESEKAMYIAQGFEVVVFETVKEEIEESKTIEEPVEPKRSKKK